MYIRASRDALVSVLGRVGGVVERRHTLPILGNFLLQAENDRLQVTGTDLEVEIRATVETKVERGGEVTIPARKLMDICRALPEGAEVSLKVEKERAILTAGKSRFALGTLLAVDFPTMDAGSGGEVFEVPEGVLKYLLEKTAFAMAQQDVRYYLNGLLLEIQPERLVTVATDGHRLAKVEKEIGVGVKEAMQIILPRKTVTELNRLLVGGAEDAVRLDVSQRLFRVEIGETRVTSKLIDGRYPDYEKVVPPLGEKVAYADREALRQALVRTSILSSEKFRGVRMRLEPGRLTLQAHNPEQEEAEEEVEVEYGKDTTVIGFNVGYLIDVLGVLDEDEVEIYVRDSNSSSVVRNKGKVGETFVVMPMRL